MPAWVTLTLDTTPPAFTGELVEDTNTFLATLSLDASPDAFEVKVWGDIDVTWPGNSDYAENEEDAPWIPYEEILQLRLAGAKRIQVRVRDDVHNASEAQLFEGIPGEGPPPTPPPTTRPVPFGQPTPPVEQRTIVTRSTIRFSSHDRVAVQTRRTPRGQAVSTRSRILVRSRDHVGARRRDSSPVLARTRERRAALRVGVTSVVRMSAIDDIGRRSEGPDTEAALIELDLL